MNQLYACDNCRSIMGMQSMIDNKQGYILTGTVLTYTDDIKMYVKRCCLIACYIGADRLCRYGVNENFSTYIKHRAPKYVITDTDAFPVYEIPLHKKETIRDILYCETPNNIIIDRYFHRGRVTSEYKFVTKRAYEKKLTAPTPMDVDYSASASGGTPSNIEYVYLIRERTAVVSDQQIYKVGRTSQPNFERFKGYPKGYEILLHLACDDSKTTESCVLRHFRSKYKKVDNYGSEYFEGDYRSMIKDLFMIVCGS